MARATRNFPTAIAITASTSMVFQRVTVSIYGAMAATIKVTSNKAFATALEFGRRTTKRIAKPIEATIYWIENQVMASMFGRTASTTKETSSRTSVTVMESFTAVDHWPTKVCGRMARKLHI